MTRVILGVILGLYRDNGKENGNFYRWRVESLGLTVWGLGFGVVI